MQLEQLEDRLMPSLGPVAPLHFAPSSNPGDPTGAGFNLVAVYALEQLALVPQGCQALVSLGNVPTGVTAGFLAAVKPYLGNPKVYGFYIADEPNPATVSAATIKAESDWIHQNDPGAKVFMVLGPGPIFSSFTPQSTGVDLIGLDPYPSRSWGFDPWYIPEAVFAAELLGWSPAQMVPVYQGFGGEGSFAAPSVAQVQLDLALWGMLTPTPAFDYTYSWADWSGGSLSTRPDLQAVFAEHNAAAWNPIAAAESCLAAIEQRVDQLFSAAPQHLAG